MPATNVIEVPEELASRFRTATPELREKALFRMLLALRAASDGMSDTPDLGATLDAFSRQGRERGLTPKVLDDILGD